VRTLSRGLAGAAVLIGVLTIAARIAGFTRTYVFSQTVGTSCLAQAYFTATQIPAAIFEIVAGGALASAVVPILAAPAERGNQARVRKISSALLGWVILALAPLALAVALLTRPIVELLVSDDLQPGCARAEVVDAAAEMLLVFSPMVVLYGLAVVLYGVLQAHRRFAAPALAPLVSSLVVIAAYLLFVPYGAGYQNDLAGLPRTAELILSIGTSMGAVAMVGTAVVAMARLRLWPRLSLGFPPGVARRARRLAAAGLATVVAQQISVLTVVRLSGSGTTGALASYNFAWAIYLLPWAILAVPIATSAYPTLSARAGDPAAFDRVMAATTRAVLLVSCAGAAGLVAVALPAGDLFTKDGDPAVLTRTILCFAPGLIGYGFVAHLGRALYACAQGKAAAGSIVIGWSVVIIANLVLVPGAERAWVVAMLGAANSVGMTVAGVLLLAALVRARGRAAVAGLGRAAAAGAVGGLAGGAAGYGLAYVLGTGGWLVTVGVAAAAAVVAGALFLAAAFAIDGRALRAVLSRKVAA
jgi:putative peptidoglycan lipid II flippase